MTSSIAWRQVFALGLAVRPLLLVPLMGSLGPEIMLVGVAIHLLVAAGVYLGNKWVTLFGIYAGVLAAVTPVLYSSILGPSPWIWINAAYGVLLTGVGVMTWRARRAAST